MTDYSFADIYHSENLAPTAELIQSRKTVCDKLRGELSVSQYCDLVSLYFDFTVTDLDWFKTPMTESDASFSLLGNKRECAVMAACMLNDELNESNSLSALLIVAANIQGFRKPAVFPQLIQKSTSTLAAVSSSRRQAAIPDLSKIKQTMKPKAGEEIQAVTDSVKALSAQAFTALETLSEQVGIQREEIDMLWWYIGGWSNKLNVSFKTIPPALGAVIAGMDLAELSQDEVGPVAAKELLRRIVSKQPDVNTSIVEAVDKITDEALKELELNVARPEFSPVLSAFQRAKEIGKSPAWHESYKKSSYFDPSKTFTPIQLATQSYLEVLLNREIKGE